MVASNERQLAKGKLENRDVKTKPLEHGSSDFVSEGNKESIFNAEHAQTHKTPVRFCKILGMLLFTKQGTGSRLKTHILGTHQNSLDRPQMTKWAIGQVELVEKQIPEVPAKVPAEGQSNSEPFVTYLKKPLAAKWFDLCTFPGLCQDIDPNLKSKNLSEKPRVAPEDNLNCDFHLLMHRSKVQQRLRQASALATTSMGSKSL